MCGAIFWISSTTKLTDEVRKNLPPEDIEAIYTELQSRKYWGLLLIVIAMFPTMIYLVI
jgi:hypothetical protein